MRLMKKRINLHKISWNAITFNYTIDVLSSTVLTGMHISSHNSPLISRAHMRK